MIRYILAALAGLALIGVAFVPAHAGCFPWADVQVQWKAKYGEVPTTIGIAGNGIVVTVLVNPESKTWTMFGQRSADIACELLHGEGWEPAPASIANPPAEDHPAIPHMQEFEGGNGSKYWLVPVRR